MLFKALLGAELSGSVGGIVASHNKGGTYFRIRAIPTNPNTPQQQTVRNAFSLLSTQWFNVLTAAQRVAWELYAFNVKVLNRIGEQVNISGLSMFVRNNTARNAGNAGQVLDAPTDFTNSVFLSQLPSNATAAAQTVDFNFSNNPLVAPWANEANSFLLTYLSRPQNLSIKFFKGPYRFAGFLQGDPIPPVPPFVANAPFAFVAGQKLFWRQVITQADGRISDDSRGEVIAVA